MARIPHSFCEGLEQQRLHAGHLRRHSPEYELRVQRAEAITYSLVVIVFYAAIVLIVLGTNMHRCKGRRGRRAEPQATVKWRQPRGTDRTRTTAKLLAVFDTQGPTSTEKTISELLVNDKDFDEDFSGKIV